jgi:orotate phosphoribosyltransferase
MERRDLAAAIRRASHLEGEFRLRSGAVAHRYFDKYQFEGDPRLLRAVAESLADLVFTATCRCSLDSNSRGVPLATMLGQLTGLPVVFVRKAAKEFTSGGQIIESARELRALGAQVGEALCVIDRESGGPEALASEGIALRALFRMTELDDALADTR